MHELASLSERKSSKLICSQTAPNHPRCAAGSLATKMASCLTSVWTPRVVDLESTLATLSFVCRLPDRLSERELAPRHLHQIDDQTTTEDLPAPGIPGTTLDLCLGIAENIPIQIHQKTMHRCSFILKFFRQFWGRRRS